MSSPSKAQSARANGARSHGPVTAEGKQKSARNSTRHGLLSNTVVLQGESPERFQELLAELTADLHPCNSVEAALVETMAVARWRYLRVLSIQKVQFEIEMARRTEASQPLLRAALAFRHLADHSRSLDLLHRYEVSYDRQFNRALNSLLKLRARHSAGEQPAAAAAPSASMDPPSAGAPETMALENSEFPIEPTAAITPSGATNTAPLLSSCSSPGEPTNGLQANVLSDPRHKRVPRPFGPSGAFPTGGKLSLYAAGYPREEQTKVEL